jgi:hypothetical protein
MMTRKEKYQNQRTKEIKEFDAEVDGNNHIPMYQHIDGDEWKAMPKWALNVVNSQFFFESAHNNKLIKTTKPPLDGSDFPYGVT